MILVLLILAIDLTIACTTSSDTISYSIVQYESEPLPSWVSIDSSSHTLTLNNTNVLEGTSYKFSTEFYASSEPTKVFQKPIFVSVAAASETDASSKYAKIVSYSLIVAIVGVVSLSVLFSLSSPVVLWAILGQFQLLLLLPLTTAYIHSDIVDYLKAFDYALLSMSFIPSDDILGEGTLSLDYNQEDAYLNDIGFGSGSAFANISPLIIFVLMIISVHITMLTIYK
jgi:hypothetical protein